MQVAQALLHSPAVRIRIVDALEHFLQARDGVHDGGQQVGGRDIVGDRRQAVDGRGGAREILGHLAPLHHAPQRQRAGHHFLQLCGIELAVRRVGLEQQALVQVCVVVGGL